MVTHGAIRIAAAAKQPHWASSRRHLLEPTVAIAESEQEPPRSVLGSAAREWEAGDREHPTLPSCLLPETPQRDLGPGRRAAHQQADPPTWSSAPP